MPELIQKSSPPNPLPPSLYAAPPSGPPEPPPPPSPPPPPAVSSTVTDWEKYEGLRQTFLIHFPLETQEAFQHIARFAYDAILEKPAEHPLPGPWTAWELHAALAEIRFLEGYLVSVMREKDVSSLPPRVEKLCALAAGAAAGLQDVSMDLERGLAEWQRKYRRGSR
ncbi:MAG TPA: hypothetical protein VIE43_15280 [Thermoanaerobaculia bacterium]|nr:hypothetical protein [Thermoanaerobaculia bacterium]